MPQPVTVKISLSAEDLLKLLDVGQLFLTLALVVQGLAPTKMLDGILTHLHNHREFLERFNQIAQDMKFTPPVEVLNFMAKKRILNLTATAEALRMCTTLSHFYLGIYLAAMKQAALTKSAGEIILDPHTLH